MSYKVEAAVWAAWAILAAVAAYVLDVPAEYFVAGLFATICIVTLVRKVDR